MKEQLAARSGIAPDKRAAPIRAAGIAATAAVTALAVLLAVRPFTSYDIGYHLAYGDHFLRTGQIVQTNRFIYSKLDKDRLADPNELGPGCRYDAQTATYHFVNANWLSQAVMAAAYRAGLKGGGPGEPQARAGGFSALCILQATLVGAIFAVLVVTMRRCGAAWHWIAPAVLLAAMTAYERFNLRPEVFGYLVLVWQWCLLVGRRFGWRGAAGVIALQALAVNLHSYFLLGIALAGVMFLDVFLRWLWGRTVTQEVASAARAVLKWRTVALVGVILASLCNPRFVRGAVMPVETVIFMHSHHIGGPVPDSSTVHPWATIGEFTTPFAEALGRAKATRAYVVLLCVTGLAGVVAPLRRRWGYLAALAGMTVVSLKMRRNIAPAAMILAPLSLIILTDGWAWLRESLPGKGEQSGRKVPWRAVDRASAWSAATVALATTAAAVWWIVAVVGQQFYFSERRSWRFGRGVSAFSVPLGAADWINTHQPKGRLFTDYDTSSNLMYFTSPRREVPVLTNTWAFPPYLMERVLQCTIDPRRFERLAREYDVGVLALRGTAPNKPLIRHLTGAADWAVVYVGVKHVVFIRRGGANAPLAEKHEITPENFNRGRFIEEVSARDSVPAFSLNNAALMLMHMHWPEHALAVWQEAVHLEPDYFEAQSTLGISLAMRATRKLLKMQGLQKKHNFAEADRYRGEGIKDWQEAERCLRRALETNPDYEPAQKNLDLLHKQVEAFKRGTILVPPML